MLYKVGGYVHYDTPKKDEWGFPVRTCTEVYTEVELGNNTPDDCGYGTETACKALEAKVAKRFKRDRNVECRECWQA